MNSSLNNRGGDIIEIIERDNTMRKSGSWKFNVEDKKLANSILSYIIRKYNFNPAMKPSQEKEAGFFNLDPTW